MSTKAVNDWAVKVGWDASEAEAGHKRLNELMSKLAKLERLTGAAAVTSGRRQEASARRVENIEGKRLRAQQLLFQLKKSSGASSEEVTKLQNQLNATKSIAGYNKVIQNTQKEILETRKREYAESQRLAKLEKERKARDALIPKVTKEKIKREYDGPASKVGFISDATKDKQVTKIDAELRKANAELAKLSGTQAFETQGRKLAGFIQQLEMLKTAVRGAGTSETFNNLTADVMRTKGELDATIGTVKTLKKEIDATSKTKLGQKKSGDVLGDFSKITPIKSETVEKQLIRLNKLAATARLALTKVPQDVSFDRYRQNANKAIQKIEELKEAYKRVGNTRAFDQLSPDAMRAKNDVASLTAEVRNLQKALAEKDRLAAKESRQTKQKEQPAPFSKVNLVDLNSVEKQIIRLDNLAYKAHVALLKIPEGVKFDLQRGNLQNALKEIQQLKAEYRTAGTKQAYDKLVQSQMRLTQEAGRYVQHANQVDRAMNAQKFAAEKLKNSFNNLAASYLSVFAAIGGAQSFIRVGMEFEALDAMMLGVSGTVQQAGKDFDFISSQALRLGADLMESTRSFAKFGMAASLSEFDDSSIKDMFTQIMEVNRAFGLTKERQSLTFLAFEQMLSKGAVSMEELRRQLGENWYGAFTQAAKAMGLTGQELSKLVETGKLASTDFLPKFLNQMQDFVTDNGMLEASMKKVSAEQGRLNTLWQKSNALGFEAGQKDFAGFFKDLQQIIIDNEDTIVAFGAGLGTALKLVSQILRTVISPALAVVGRAFKNFGSAIKTAMDATKDWSDLTAFEKALRGVGIVVEYLNLSLLYLRKYLLWAFDAMGMGDDSSKKLTDQIVSFGVVLLTMLPALALFRGMLRFALISPLSSILKLLGSVASGLLGLKLPGWLKGKAGTPGGGYADKLAKQAASARRASWASRAVPRVMQSPLPIQAKVVIAGGLLGAAAAPAGLDMLASARAGRESNFGGMIYDWTHPQAVNVNAAGRGGNRSTAKQVTQNNTFHIQANDTEGVAREVVRITQQQIYESSTDTTP